jgi:hypothetical protein
MTREWGVGEKNYNGKATPGGTPRFLPSLKFSTPDYGREQFRWEGRRDEKSLDRGSFDWGQGNSWECHRHIWLPTEGGRACSRLGARNMVETDRAQFTVQQRCCDRKAAGEEEVPRAETIYLGHEEQAAGEGGQRGLLVFKAKQDVRKDWPMPRQPAELPSAHACGSTSH